MSRAPGIVKGVLSLGCVSRWCHGPGLGLGVQAGACPVYFLWRYF